MNKHALWISRHPMDAEAEKELRKVFGVEGIDLVDFAFAEDSVKALEELKDLVKSYEFFGGVFPAQLWYSMVNNALSRKEIFEGKKLFLIISKSLPVENGIRKFQFDHIEYLTF